MKTKKLFIINLFLFCTILTCSFNIHTKAAGKNYTITYPIFDTEFYEGDFQILNKGYYLIVGSGDLTPTTITGNVKAYYNYGDISSNTFKQNIPVPV